MKFREWFFSTDQIRGFGRLFVHYSEVMVDSFIFVNDRPSHVAAVSKTRSTRRFPLFLLPIKPHTSRPQNAWGRGRLANPSFRLHSWFGQTMRHRRSNQGERRVAFLTNPNAITHTDTLRVYFVQKFKFEENEKSSFLQLKKKPDNK